MNARIFRPLCLLLCCILLAACATRTSPDSVIGGDILDLRRYPQDLRVYADKAGADVPLLHASSLAEHWERYKRLYFGPWQAEKAGIRKEDAFSALKGAGYAENLLPRSRAAVDALVRNSNQPTYPNRLENGIVVRATALRAAPTDLPRFYNPLKAGEGYPFDMWQYATLPLGMPVLMTHTSLDGAWIFVETALAAGWVAEQDLAGVDAAFMEQYRSAPLLAVVREDTLLTAASGKVVARADIGTLLAGAGTAGQANVLIPVRTAQGMAQAVRVRVEPGAVRNAPLVPTPGALADLGNQLMGETYGWGGMYGHRDCSAMLRDLFTPFGIWLPRNSAAQAKAWSFSSLDAITPDGKEDQIIRTARPFATLLWLPGHITLYLGEYEGNAVMFHDIWGIRTEIDGKEGRYVLGRALVSGVRPGAELPDVQPGSDLLSRMKGLSTLQNRP